jgi:beta-galactosidase
MTKESDSTKPPGCSRREFIRNCSLVAATLASGAILNSRPAKAQAGPPAGPAHFLFPLDQNWLFGGKFKASLPDTAFSEITLPHCVTKLSWQNWDPADWADAWIYRRHFSTPAEFKNRRVFLHFDGVMSGAKPVFNGVALPEYIGAYLPFQYELTQWLKTDDNVLEVTVDSRWQDAPPEGNPKGPKSVDYLEPGGISRPVTLRAVPRIFISDVFAKPVNVLAADRQVEITCSINAAVVPKKPLQVKVEMLDGNRLVASALKTLTLTETGETEWALTLSDLGDVKLWDVDAPQLYDIVTTLIVDDAPMHDHRLRIGLREARFEIDGFFLNGRRLRLFGLDRHEIYPYTGFAMPGRVMRRDAEILKHEFNCNIVRCSHYPQSAAFLDACDELGLMVWEETPGWNYLGDNAWKELVVRDVEAMVRRDRNRPSIVIWGVRVNESKNDPPLYERTKALAKSLDGSRPTSGSMTVHSTKGWQQDVFALDDYHSAPDGSVGIDAPLPGVPYMLAESVGQYSYGSKGFNNKYRRAGDLPLQMAQALFHAQAHDKAAAFPRFCGVIAWCAFDYASLMSADHAVKCPGVADVFRIPKLGASFYQAQINPAVRPVIQPDFYWDFSPKSPRGPGQRAAIFSNCDRLEIFVAGKSRGNLQPDREHFPNLKFPPFFADLELDGASQPELRIDGYVGGKLVLSRSFSADPAKDQFSLKADDVDLVGDGADATRLVFKVEDQFGADRAFAAGTVAFEITGAGVLIGDNPFALAASGGVGAVWIKTVPNGAGNITVTATHSTLGSKSVEVRVQPDAGLEKI